MVPTIQNKGGGYVTIRDTWDMLSADHSNLARIELVERVIKVGNNSSSEIVGRLAQYLGILRRLSRGDNPINCKHCVNLLLETKTNLKRRSTLRASTEYFL